MKLTRRAFTAGAAGLGLAHAAGFSPRAAHAEITLGDIRLDVVSDGSLTLPGSFIFDGMPKDELQPILDTYGISSEVLTPPCNVTLMRSGDRTVLFDVGSGPDFMPNAGELLDALDALGVAPEDVTDVVFTHAHPDHLWGLLDDFDDPLFTEASYLIGKAEWDYWTNPATVDEIGEARAAFAVGAQRRLAMIEDAITFFGDGEEILPGVAARATFGHTPGHMSFEVRQGTDALMVLGDSIVNHHVAFAKPEWRSGSDQDQDLAAKTRTKLIDQLATEQMPVIGFHLPGGLGRVERADGAYRFIGEA
ncbi:MAG: MBL fold metallo-hydrolase [Sulfitobacter sp.]|nr:MBL fold metallo-hydrolase [Sulfitobacter sp.]